MTPTDVLLILCYMWGGIAVLLAIAFGVAALADRYGWIIGWHPEDDQ